ncbi:MFS transporter [Cnuibacter physcomitrellae]|uniref:MFS transporter n=1 Tax=Cnuibacter physcomitrellae TaxID=1619308 RepID=UPI002175A512|nr:MFS transporter [Cnuibacter physcomitrellae]MCS5498097.1 MFS transporter [Cnuibacter physcomitrellae]
MTAVTSAWRSKAFRRVWSAGAVSGLGAEIGELAVPVLALVTLGASATELSFVRAALLVPYLLLTLWLGVVVDRRRRRPLLVIADLGRGILLAVVCALALLGWLTVPLLIAAAAVLGSLTVLYTLAEFSFVPLVVEEEQLIDANARITAAQSAIGVAGAGAGGALVQVLTAPFALVANAVGYLVSGVLIASVRVVEPLPSRGPAGGGARPRRTARMRPSRGEGRARSRRSAHTADGQGAGAGPERTSAAQGAPAATAPERTSAAQGAPAATAPHRATAVRAGTGTGPERTSAVREARAGVAVILRHRVLRALVGEATLWNLGNEVFMLALSLLVLRTLGLGPGILGLVLMAGGAGAFAGAALSRRLTARFGYGRSLIGSMLAGNAAPLVAIAGTCAIVVAGLGTGALAGVGASGADAAGRVLYGLPTAGITSVVVVLTAGMLVSGIGCGVANSQAVSLRQLAVVPELRGRANAAYRLVSWGALSIGALAGGGLVVLVGEWVAALVGTALMAVATLPVVLSPVRRTRAIEELRPATAPGSPVLPPSASARM